MLDNTEKRPTGQVVGHINVAVAGQSVTKQHPDTTAWPGQREFINAIFGPWVGPGKGVVWTTGFQSVTSGESWQGRAGVDHLEARFPTMEADLYFAIGVMRESETRRSNTGVVAQPLLIVDDIGAKVDPAKWEALIAAGCPQPTAEIETSPNNWTWVWALAGDAMAPERWTDLALIRAYLVDAKLTDDVMDPARYIRLPGGWNSKPKYRGPNGDGPPPKVKLTAWRLDTDGRVDVEALGEAIVGKPSGVSVMGPGAWRSAPPPKSVSAQSLLTSAQIGKGEGNGALVRTADLSKPDALMRLAVELGMQPQQVRQGVVEALCPNIAAHTTRPETGFAFLGNGLMHCNHASCQGLSTVAFRQMMLDQMDAQDGREGAGREWLAREEMRDAGAFSDTADALATAQAMQANTAQRLLREVSDEGEAVGAVKRRRPPHEIALDYMQVKGIVPYIDRKGGGVVVRVGGRWVNLAGSAGQNRLMGWLGREGIQLHGTGAKHLLEILAARAAANGEVDVHYRVARSGTQEDPTIYVNLMDAENRAVEITRDGWKQVHVADADPVLMHRQGGLPLPVPVHAGDGLTFLDRLVRHVPVAPVVRPNDPTDAGVMQRATVLTFCLAQFLSGCAVPHMVLAGEQGGGKTTTARRFNGLTDPDAGGVLSRLASDEGKIFSQVAQLSNVVWDNSSAISAAHADVLCCLATGASYATRRLYTNDERSLSSALCSVIFTSVLDSGLTRRPDLQDRMLVLATPPLPKDKRRSESELDAAWSADLPHLLADLFDLLALGLRHMADVRAAQRMGVFPPPPRFADVAQVAEAAAWRGLGWSAGLLTRALNNLRADAAHKQLSDDPIAHRLRELLRQQQGGVWRGSYEELERALAYLDGPTWDRHRVPLQAGVSRVLGPLRELWGIEREEVGRKHRRIYEWRLAAASSAGLSTQNQENA